MLKSIFKVSAPIILIIIILIIGFDTYQKTLESTDNPIEIIVSDDDSGIATEDDGTIQMEELADPSTPDVTQQMPQEIYYIDRKSLETREVVEFELASAFDLAGIRVPKRQCLPEDFPGIGTFV